MEREQLRKNGCAFASHYYSVNGIGTMHDVDEGSGEVIVMVHGNPA